MQSRTRYVALLLLTLPLGSIVRFGGFHWPYAISKYGGSALWAIAIYWMVSVLAPRRSVVFRALVALGIAFAIEFFKLVRTPGLDAFRLTLPGKLVLGRVLGVSDLVAYAVGIGCAAVLDRAVSGNPRSAKIGLR